MPAPRPTTDLYLGAVHTAAQRPGTWVTIDRLFNSEKNADVTAYCLREGYLRVRPGRGELAVTVNGKQWLRTPVPVETRVQPVDGASVVSIRAGDRAS